MKCLKSICLILLFSLLGEVCRFLIPLTIPASIYGVALLFVVPTVGLMEYWHLVKPVLIPFVFISLVVTILVLAAGGLVTKWILRKGAKENDADD